MTRETSVERARTLMSMHEYSQLPVLHGERTVHGMVSWKSIGEAAARRIAPRVVGDCLDDKPISLRRDTPLLDAIDEIAKREVILVRGIDRTIVGLVTTTDLSEELRGLSEAFLLVGEVERHIRRLIHEAKFGVEELKAVVSSESGRFVGSARDLSFGEYVRLLERPDNWARFELHVDRAELLGRLEAVRKIRNAIMHFRQDVEKPDLKLLRGMVRFLKRL